MHRCPCCQVCLYSKTKRPASYTLSAIGPCWRIEESDPNGINLQVTLSMPGLKCGAVNRSG